MSVYNICDKSLQPIKTEQGFITSPKFPTYTATSDECTQIIQAPEDKIIKIWIVSMYIKSPDFYNE